MMYCLSQAMAIVPVTVFLTASFFVLFAVSKIDAKNLKSFGYLVTGLLWLSAALIFFASVYGSLARRNEMMNLKRGMMMQRQMQQMPPMPAPDGKPMAQQKGK